MMYLMVQANDDQEIQSKLPDVPALFKSNRDDANVVEKEIAELKK